MAQRQSSGRRHSARRAKRILCGQKHSTAWLILELQLLLCFGHCIPGANSQAILAHVGDTVTLPYDGPADKNTKEILWMCSGRPVCSFKNGSWCETGHYANRTQLGSIQQNNFSLVITSVRKEDNGFYSIRINYIEIRSIRLIVKGDGNRRDAETPPRDPVCRPYREREDPPGSETKDKQYSDENTPGASSGGNLLVIEVIVGFVVTVAATVGAAVLIRRQWNRQRFRIIQDHLNIP